MGPVGLGPDFPDWPDSVAPEDNREENGNVKSQVTPDQNMTGPIDVSGLRGCEDAYLLEE